MKKTVTLLLLTGVALTVCFGPGLADSGKYSKVAWLGVSTQTVSGDLARSFDLPVNYGALVNDVSPDSPADKAGIREDDVIIALDGAKVSEAGELTDLVREHSPGDEVTVTLNRDGQEQEVKVELGARRAKYKSLDSDYPMVMDDFRWRGDQEQSYIGVVLMDLSEQLGDYFGVPDGHGTLISEVEEESPAEKAGLKAGDVIVGIDDEEMEDAGDVSDMIGEKDEGDKVNITVLRNRRETRVAVEVGKREGALSWVLPRRPSMTKRHIMLQVPDPKEWRFEKDLELDDIFDSDEFREEMEELREELKELKEELSKLKGSGR
ncbi:MAG TPA: PDZ domain-containing protein [Acidobacteriota bacterium]|nr:PDZ domain-containing protein [Acidobacteriota bacterium]